MSCFQTDELEKYLAEMEYIVSALKGKTVFLTGGTGFVGRAFVGLIQYANTNRNLNCKLVLCVRDYEKARRLFGEDINIVKKEIEEKILFTDDIDYIIHLACPTNSAYMISNPVDVVKTSIMGTINLLELAKEKNASFLYVSSMEVYGTVRDENLLTEDLLGYVNPLVARSCYPESKRMCEAIVVSYVNQYNVDAKSIRLAQVIGPGIDYNDPKVFVMMARAAIENKKIELLTRGESKHSYIYILDAVSAILAVLILGKNGESYNAANMSTYCSIYDMAMMVSKLFGGENCIVEICENESDRYPDTSYINMDCRKISGLGWSPQEDLEGMFRHLIKYLKDSRCENYEK